MAAFTVQEIVRATRGALVAGDLGVPVTGVSIDSRALSVGEAFFAIRGHRLDGHAFLADAAGRGAACLVVHALHDDAPANVPLVLVEDTTKALGLLAAYHRARFSIPVDRKSTRLNSSHLVISYAVFCLKKKKKNKR